MPPASPVPHRRCCGSSSNAWTTTPTGSSRWRTSRNISMRQRCCLFQRSGALQPVEMASNLVALRCRWFCRFFVVVCFDVFWVPSARVTFRPDSVCSPSHPTRLTTLLLLASLLLLVRHLLLEAMHLFLVASLFSF